MPFTVSELSVAPAYLWLAFSVGVWTFIAIDLTLFHKNDKAVTVRSALRESAFWISLALGFNAWFLINYGKELGLQFLTGYIIEKSLSVDNLFIILLVFGSFRIPTKFQHRVLFYGVLGAIIMRGILILFGAQILHHSILLFIFLEQFYCFRLFDFFSKRKRKLISPIISQ